jgi:hypothetical protein
MSVIESREFNNDMSYSGFTFLNDAYHPSIGITLNASHGSRIPKTWILLDNHSTVDVFHKSDLLEQICLSEDSHMDIHCNATVTSTNLVGDLPRYGTVWYHPKGIANILLLNSVKEKYCVSYDSTNKTHSPYTRKAAKIALSNNLTLGCSTWTPPRQASC